jgi:PilZ domain
LFSLQLFALRMQRIVTVIEKRKVERFDLQLEAFISGPGGVSQAESAGLVTRDISMSGVFLITDRPLPVGSKVSVDMILTLGGTKKQDSQKAWIKASGKVLRTDSQGMAVRFDDQSRILPLSKKS